MVAEPPKLVALSQGCSSRNQILTYLPRPYFLLISMKKAARTAFFFLNGIKYFTLKKKVKVENMKKTVEQTKKYTSKRKDNIVKKYRIEKPTDIR